MTLVVDASVAFKWFFVGEANAAEALAVAESSEPIIAPELVIAEVCNAAWRSARIGRIDAHEVPVLAATLSRFFAELTGATALASRAVTIAQQLDHPVYDCFYIALAEVRQVPLITADARLLAKLRGSPWTAATVALVDYPMRP